MDALIEPVLAPRDDASPRQRALQAGARTLVALATQLRRAAVPSPEAMKQGLAAAIARFEHDLQAAGWDERGTVAASYVLCAWLDEVVADTPWGHGGAGLLAQFHGEADGGDRVLRLLARLAEQPRENRALLELFHACLSLGLTGSLKATPDAARRLEALRRAVYEALPREAPALAPPLATALAGRARPRSRRFLVGGLVALGLTCIGVYTAAHLSLARQVDEVFASMQQLGGARPIPAAAPAVPRLAPLMPDLPVRDEAHRSVVSLDAERLYERGSTHLSAGGAALLGRVGAVLAKSPGKVVVVGHTDGADLRNARLPSAWHQSFEWAREAAAALGAALPAERLAVEGAADLRADGDANLPRRRVDIVLYP